MSRRRVTITRNGGFLDLSRDGDAPLEDAEYDLVLPLLEYDKLVTLHGRDAYDPVTGQYRPVAVEKKRLYDWEDDRLICQSGNLDRFEAAFAAAGYRVKVRDRTDWGPRSRALEPDWDALASERFRPLQEPCLRALAARIDARRGGIVKAIPGFGKAQPLDATVYTPRGPKRMGDIRVGDRVCSPNGTTRVVAIHPQGVRPIYRITFRDGAAVECCGDHLWKIDGSRKCWKAPRVVDTKFLAANYKSPQGELYFSIALPRPLRFDRAPLSVPPYLLGVLLGDGCLRAKGLTFTTADPEIASGVGVAIAGSGLAVRQHRRRLVYGVAGRGKVPNPYTVELRRLGLMGCGSSDKFIPDEFLYASIKDRWELLRGLMDTDGHVSKAGAVVYYTVSDRLADDVQRLVESLGGVCTRSVKKTTHKDCHRLGVLLPDARKAFRLPRKRARVTRKTKYFPKRIIADVALVDEKPCQCITVAAPDGLYVTDHCVITHNSFAMRAIALLYRRARIAIAIPDVDNCNKTYAHLVDRLPSVGLVGGGTSLKGRRVTVYTLGSLHHCDPDHVDILLVDEAHKFAADNASEKLGRILGRRALPIGLTATPEGRLDGADAKLEAIFGPVIFEVDWATGLEHRLVTPITVRWDDVHLVKNPCDGLRGLPRRRHGIWRNGARNKIVAAAARAYDDDEQVLVMCSVVEHALHLKRKLPGFELVYALTDVDRLDDLGAMRAFRKLDDADFRPMTRERRENLRTAFEKGTLRKVIATDVWSHGVSFDRLSVVVRADARSNRIIDEQIPGRVSRIADGKESALVRDFLDQFDPRFRDLASERRRNYKANGWREVLPDRDGARSRRGRHT